MSGVRFLPNILGRGISRVNKQNFTTLNHAQSLYDLYTHTIKHAQTGDLMFMSWSEGIYIKMVTGFLFTHVVMLVRLSNEEAQTWDIPPQNGEKCPQELPFQKQEGQWIGRHQ